MQDSSSLNDSFALENMKSNYFLYEQSDFDYDYPSMCVHDDLSSIYSAKNLFFNNICEKSTGVGEVITKELKINLHKYLGRKKKGEKSKKGSHNKYSYDNMIGKVKHLIYKELFNLINDKISVIYNGKIGHGIFIKILMLAKEDQIANSTIEFNKKFLNKTLEEIFSEELSNRINNYPKDHNLILVKKLMNEDDIEKREYFKGLFSLTFLDCLKYFRNENDDKYVYIEGLKRFDDLVNDNIFNEDENDEDYVECLRECIDNYETTLDHKKGRKPRKKNHEENHV